jgi:hypothetical protein
VSYGRDAGGRRARGGGGDPSRASIRVVLGDKRLQAHLVTVEGTRGWKLTGRIAGFYVFYETHHRSDTLLM